MTPLAMAGKGCENGIISMIGPFFQSAPPREFKVNLEWRGWEATTEKRSEGLAQRWVLAVSAPKNPMQW